MADYFWGRIEIGGDLRRQHLPRFCQAVGADDEFDLLRFIEDGHIVLDNCEARYGQFEELEDACREIGLPYTRQSDGKYEFSPEVVFWQPGMTGAYTVITDHDHNMQVSMDDVRAIRDALVGNDIPSACFLADKAIVDLPALPPFQVV
ncbi:MAG: hypothetical protein HN742_11225 [Lentisphaerae bacterium]|jgi:hypothetical protein|nr:hypothetical protein [Lentisphaerota bacterium]MBT4822136.1 hypothetical protein [Lentisphaerota bacterium]MBT5610525.1 hypothetical protein [Lentisphaerota bacterium]MBT7056080.1 hypothetical protein [Lentisphaerota bacterium]MBT7842437.1 hypothetical protein [Lentisphaerota bacterium]